MAAKRSTGTDQLARLALVLLVVLLGVFAYLQWQAPQHPATAPSAPQSISVQMLLGNPSRATAEASNRDNYLMVKPYYALSYNDSRGGANWVSWRLTRADLGDAPRKRVFDPDNELPPGFQRITSREYAGSGFDRGHLCPHSDRAANQEMSFATFVMTNIIPHAPNVNQKAWAQLEDYCRDLVSRDRARLYIIAGPAGRGGLGSSGSRDAIGRGRVVVPAECWKIVVVVPESGGEDDLARITPRSRVISVIMPNDNNAVGEVWAEYRTTAANVERRTGLRFFDSLSADVAESLRQKLDTQSIRRPRRR